MPFCIMWGVAEQQAYPAVVAPLFEALKQTRQVLEKHTKVLDTRRQEEEASRRNAHQQHKEEIARLQQLYFDAVGPNLAQAFATTEATKMLAAGYGVIRELARACETLVGLVSRAAAGGPQPEGDPAPSTL